MSSIAPNTSRGIIRPYHGAFVFGQRALDMLMVAATHVAAVFFYSGAEWSQLDSIATTFAAVAFVFAGDTVGLYLSYRGASAAREWRQVCTTWGIVVAGLLLLAFATKQSASLSRVVMLCWFASAPIFVCLWRSVGRLFLREARRRGHNTRRAAIMGFTEMGGRVAERIFGTPSLGLQVDGFYDDREPERCAELKGHSIAGGFADLVERARNGELDVIYVCLPLKAEERVNAILRQLADTTASVHIVPDFLVFDLAHGRWGALADIPTVSVFETPFMGGSRMLKRVQDIVLGSLAVLVAAVPMMVIAAGVKLTSRGPVFFRQRRYGLNGRLIHVWKFRTMTVAEDGAEVRQATKSDSRITRFGAFLRRNSLDELPQLLHVVGGSMSLVGPRPHAVAHNEQYRKRIHGYMLRHKVKPGLTGWAQVNGWRGETDTLEKMEMRIEHDLDYIRRWDLFLDMKIVFLTVFGRQVRKNAH